jgi:hypothetical protein
MRRSRVSPWVLAAAAVLVLSAMGRAAPSRKGAPRRGGGTVSIAFKAGAVYALVFDLEEGPRTLSEPELLREVLSALESLGMVPLPGSPAAGDPVRVRAKATASRSFGLPLHFRDIDRAVYLLSATPLGPDIHGGARA